MKNFVVLRSTMAFAGPDFEIAASRGCNAKGKS
jgi:hypothetical protein